MYKIGLSMFEINYLLDCFILTLYRTTSTIFCAYNWVQMR